MDSAPKNREAFRTNKANLYDSSHDLPVGVATERQANLAVALSVMRLRTPSSGAGSLHGGSVFTGSPVLGPVPTVVTITPQSLQRSTSPSRLTTKKSSQQLMWQPQTSHAQSTCPTDGSSSESRAPVRNTTHGASSEHVPEIDLGVEESSNEPSRDSVGAPNQGRILAFSVAPAPASQSPRTIQMAGRMKLRAAAAGGGGWGPAASFGDVGTGGRGISTGTAATTATAAEDAALGSPPPSPPPGPSIAPPTPVRLSSSGGAAFLVNAASRGLAGRAVAKPAGQRQPPLPPPLLIPSPPTHPQQQTSAGSPASVPEESVEVAGAQSPPPVSPHRPAPALRPSVSQLQRQPLRSVAFAPVPPGGPPRAGKPQYRASTPGLPLAASLMDGSPAMSGSAARALLRRSCSGIPSTAAVAADGGDGSDGSPSSPPAAAAAAAAAGASGVSMRSRLAAVSEGSLLTAAAARGPGLCFRTPSSVGILEAELQAEMSSMELEELEEKRLDGGAAGGGGGGGDGTGGGGFDGGGGAGRFSAAASSAIAAAAVPPAPWGKPVRLSLSGVAVGCRLGSGEAMYGSAGGGGGVGSATTPLARVAGVTSGHGSRVFSVSSSGVNLSSLGCGGAGGNGGDGDGGGDKSHVWAWPVGAAASGNLEGDGSDSDGGATIPENLGVADLMVPEASACGVAHGNGGGGAACGEGAGCALEVVDATCDDTPAAGVGGGGGSAAASAAAEQWQSGRLALSRRWSARQRSVSTGSGGGIGNGDGGGGADAATGAGTGEDPGLKLELNSDPLLDPILDELDPERRSQRRMRQSVTGSKRQSLRQRVVASWVNGNEPPDGGRSDGGASSGGSGSPVSPATPAATAAAAIGQAPTPLAALAEQALKLPCVGLDALSDPEGRQKVMQRLCDAAEAGPTALANALTVNKRTPGGRWLH